MKEAMRMAMRCLLALVVPDAMGAQLCNAQKAVC
jgi:hypothetical protein